MHALHHWHWDRRPLVAAVAALLLTLVMALAAVSLPHVEFGSGGATASSAPAATTPQAERPAWVSDPLAPPALLRE